MRFGGYAVGSFMIGLLYTFVNPLLVNALALIVSGILTASTGWTSTYAAILAVTLLNGFCSGMIDNVNNVFCLELWGKENQPFMQALHFMYGVGGLISPLVVSPYLAPKPEVSMLSNETVSVDENFLDCSLIDVNLRQPYVMIAIFTELVAMYTLYLFIMYRETTPHPSRQEDKSELTSPSKINISVRNAIWVLTAIFTHFVIGLEIAMANVLTTYAVMSDLKLSKVTGAYITSAYWCGFTFFRIAAVFYISYVGSFYNLIFDLSLLVVANVFLIPWANSVEWCLWAGAVFIGLGVSSMWASMFGFLEEYFPVSSKMASSFTVSACLGEFIFPFLMGYLVNVSPTGFLYSILAITVSICIIFASMVYLCKTKLAIKEKELFNHNLKSVEIINVK
ncbi:hypothetical protein HDE_11783 [Halotydeus destructor]|nr:hypothetical protein HDE_11783 [Halotydeus destructor]